MIQDEESHFSDRSEKNMMILLAMTQVNPSCYKISSVFPHQQVLPPLTDKSVEQNPQITLFVL